MEHISNSTIAVASEIVRIPNVDRGVPFEHLDPELKLFLWKNELTHVPKAVFDLNHLTVLSLRGNNLTELPPAILQLKNLQTLNVALNKLKHVPVELLELIYDPNGSLRNLMLHPNPWYQPEVVGPDAPWIAKGVDQFSEGQGPPGRGSRWLSHETPRPRNIAHLDAKRWARTPVQFSDTKGVVYSAFRIEPETTLLPTEDLDSEPVFPSQNPAQERGLYSSEVKTTKVHSLLELALQTCSRSRYLAQLPDMLTEATHAKVRDLLVHTQVDSYTGGVRCTVCRRRIVKPTAEWIEWWELFLNFLLPGGAEMHVAHVNPPGRQAADGESYPWVKRLTHNPEERLVPFVRRACSWKCVMDTFRGLGKQPAEGGEERGQA